MELCEIPVPHQNVIETLLVPCPAFRLYVRPIIRRFVEFDNQRAIGNVDPLLEDIRSHHQINFLVRERGNNFLVHFRQVQSLPRRTVRVIVETDHKLRFYVLEFRVCGQRFQNMAENLRSEAPIHEYYRAELLFRDGSELPEDLDQNPHLIRDVVLDLLLHGTLPHGFLADVLDVRYRGAHVTEQVVQLDVFAVQDQTFQLDRVAQGGHVETEHAEHVHMVDEIFYQVH